MPAFGDYQNEIYFAGLRGVKPKLPVDFATLERKAHAVMPDDLVDYVLGGCGNEHTQRRNVTAFEQWGVMPRMMVDCSKRDLSIDLFGLTLPTPLFMSPIGVIGMCAQDGHGDIAAARAAAATGVPGPWSRPSPTTRWRPSFPHLGETPGFFQLYTPKDIAVAGKPRPSRRGGRLQGHRGDARHLAHRLASARPQPVQLPAASRARDGELLVRSAFPEVTGEAAGGGRWPPPSPSGRGSSASPCPGTTCRGCAR